ncbi:hypothetical protein LO772_28030 [Yinghuangia sp. ASG 101]|uniref:hypothetical protein n=1 Tax=Yinghuangia sp. ASG 101 TaxID=2896848 RepID=UPI001E5906EE|nr:hypothetical protein [Yinghuangia sp. ASG 101]UGQ10646.1 hypothetical protein LO772_28030 [Yinghuangia sp. ASG 101]
MRLGLRRPRRLAAVGLAAVVCLLCVLGVVAWSGASEPSRPGTRPLLLGGIAPDPAAPGGILERPTDAGPRVPTADEQAWLAVGSVPGATETQRDMARQALLDLRLLTLPNGDVAAAWHGIWKYVWPRDAAWAAAAYAATGHGDDAARVLRRLAALRSPDGTWEARYRLDGTPVDDGRAAQLDANGWFPWATWFWYEHQRPDDPAARDHLAALWPAVREAADHAAASLGDDGLPRRSADYWETRTDQQTLGTAAPLLTGLRAAADLGRRVGAGEDAARWSAAATRLADAVDTRFGAHGYPRTPSAKGGADAAVTWLGPPFAAGDPDVDAAVRRSAADLTLPNGGILPGAKWGGDLTAAWTPETAGFALYEAASGDHAAATARLDWLAAHRTAAGSLPEKVDARGLPASVAPLAWTAAAVLLALGAQETALPTPPP